MAANSKVGLVLEGGGMRGAFTAGVLDFFLDREAVSYTHLTLPTNREV